MSKRPRSRRTELQGTVTPRNRVCTTGALWPATVSGSSSKSLKIAEWFGKHLEIVRCSLKASVGMNSQLQGFTYSRGLKRSRALRRGFPLKLAHFSLNYRPSQRIEGRPRPGQPWIHANISLESIRKWHPCLYGRWLPSRLRLHS